MTKAILLMLTGCLLAGMETACTRGALRNPALEANSLPSAPASGAEHARAIAGAGDGDGAQSDLPYPPRDCNANGCGTNTIWLGDNIRFHTLHLSPDKENEAHLSILEFRDIQGNPLTIDVQGDMLMGTDQKTHSVLRGSELNGAQLFLGHPGSGSAHKAMYVLTIEKVHYTNYWVACHGCDSTQNQFPVYKFSVSGNNGSKAKLCAPPPGEHTPLATDGPDANNIYGDAVIFRGDFYDDQTHTVSTAVTPENADLFNLTCYGTAISKLHFLRHTSASQANPDDPRNPTAQDRQTLLRLLTADYCGNGSSFTENGMPLRLAFNNQIYPLWGDGTGYSMSGAESIEALWTPDGAMCIGAPRLLRSTDPRWHDLTADKIRRMCHTAGNKTNSPEPALEDCSTLSVDVRRNWFANGNYAISGNPK